MILTSRTLRYLLAAAAIGALCLVFCTSADAQSPFWRPRPTPPPPYSFTIEDENGNSLPTFRKDGRSYLLGEPGLRYNVRVQNPTGQRVEAVVSVDGRDAVSGEPGDYVHGRGYVIPAYGSLLIEGFRRSFEEVAAFRFTSPGDSYSARMGTPQNVGVIGVAFFPERVRPQPVMRRPTPHVPRPAPRPYYGYNGYEGDDRAAPRDLGSAKRKSAGAAPSAPAAAESARRAESKGYEPEAGSVNNLGTEFGETRQSSVTSVSFERASATHPAVVSTLRYDDADGLTARGIDVSAYRYARYYDGEPQAFPAQRFAQPPR